MKFISLLTGLVLLMVTLSGVMAQEATVSEAAISSTYVDGPKATVSADDVSFDSSDRTSTDDSTVDTPALIPSDAVVSSSKRILNRKASTISQAVISEAAPTIQKKKVAPPVIDNSVVTSTALRTFVRKHIITDGVVSHSIPSNVSRYSIWDFRSFGHRGTQPTTPTNGVTPPALVTEEGGRNRNTNDNSPAQPVVELESEDTIPGTTDAPSAEVALDDVPSSPPLDAKIIAGNGKQTVPVAPEAKTPVQTNPFAGLVGGANAPLLGLVGLLVVGALYVGMNRKK